MDDTTKENVDERTRKPHSNSKQLQWTERGLHRHNRPWRKLPVRAEIRANQRAAMMFQLEKLTAWHTAGCFRHAAVSYLFEEDAASICDRCHLHRVQSSSGDGGVSR